MRERLKELRKELGLTQAEFGKVLGLSNFAISDMEKGKSSISKRNVYLICEKFGISERWLLEGIGDKYDKTLPMDDLAIACAGIQKEKYEKIKQLLILYGKLDDNSKKVVDDFLSLCIDTLKKQDGED